MASENDGETTRKFSDQKGGSFNICFFGCFDVDAAWELFLTIYRLVEQVMTLLQMAKAVLHISGGKAYSMMISHDKSEKSSKERSIQREKTLQRVVSSTNCIEGKYFDDLEYSPSLLLL